MSSTVNATSSFMSTSPLQASGHHRPLGWHYLPSRDMNILILGVILLCSLSHIVENIKAKRALRRRASQWTRITSPRWEQTEVKPGLYQRFRARINTCFTKYSNWAYLAVFPSWMYAPESVNDALWTILYCGVMAFFCSFRTPSIPGDPYRWRRFANKCGVMAYAQTPLVLILAMKNNPIQSLTGITYQKLNYLHRASTRACILASWLHTILWIMPLWENASMLRFYVLMGYLALASYSGLWILSFRFFRRRLYELFLGSHIILTLAFIVGGCLHWPLMSHWLWPSLLIWLVDRSIRLGKKIYGNWWCSPSSMLKDDCEVELVSEDVLRVVIKRKGLRWSAGQHFFLTAPSLSGMPHESHPFSIANVPRSTLSNDAIFLIRAHSGFTRQLFTACASVSGLPLHIEGPYGARHPLDHYSTVVLVAGGTGITFCLSYFMELLQPFARKSHNDDVKSCVRRIKLLWHARRKDDLGWIAPMLNTAIDELHQNGAWRDVDISVEVHVTRARVGDPMDLEMEGTKKNEQKPARIRIDQAWAAQMSGPISAPIGTSANVVLPSLAPYEGSSAERFSDPIAAGRVPLRDLTRCASDTSTGPEEFDETDHLLQRDQASYGSDRASTRSPSSSTLCSMDTTARSPYGLSQSSISHIKLFPGRANLTASICAMAIDNDEWQGKMVVVTCGPVPLMHDVRKAVWACNSGPRIEQGHSAVDLLEETVGH